MIKLKTIYIISFMLLFLTIIIKNVYSDDITQYEDIKQSEDNTQPENNSKSEDNIQFDVMPNSMDNTYSEDKSQQFDIKFANTISVGYFSNNLYREDIRSKHKTILDKPAFNIDEKFQIILSSNTGNEIEPTDIGCLSIPNSGYGSINLFYSHYENFAIRKGMGFEGGVGDYKNPFISVGMSFFYLYDIVFNRKENSNSKNNDNISGDFNFFFNIGYKDDMHLFFDISSAFIDDIGLLTQSCYGIIDMTLGYKKLIPLFFRYKASAFNNYDKKINYTDSMQYLYEHGIELYHIQYYGDSLGLSIGYSGYYERYIAKLLNDKHDGYSGNITLDERKYHGGGITFDLKNADYTFEFFGELHVLADKDYNWLTICKFGATVYF